MATEFLLDTEPAELFIVLVVLVGTTLSGGGREVFSGNWVIMWDPLLIDARCLSPLLLVLLNNSGGVLPFC